MDLGLDKLLVFGTCTSVSVLVEFLWGWCLGVLLLEAEIVLGECVMSF